MNQNRFFMIVSGLLMVLMLSCSSSPQKPEVISGTDEYLSSVKANPEMQLMDICRMIPGVVADIRYATKNNFTGEQIYTSPRAFARKPVCEALVKVQDSLTAHHLRLIIFDAYRPYAATVKFYEVYPDTNFVANPKYGSRHNRGCAVDVSLADSAGHEIAMPSGYDDFSEKAHPDYMNISPEAVSNRKLLFGIMSHFGFTHYPTEWWHFDYQGWKDYPLMDLSFDELDQANSQIR